MKTVRDSEDVTESGRLFQARAAATEKARSPIVDSTEIRAISAVVDAERSHGRLRPGEGHRGDFVVRVRSGIGMKAPLAET